MPRFRGGPLWRRSFRLKIKKQTAFSIAQVVLFAFSGIIILSFSRQGIILLRLNELLIRFFSWTAFFLPFLFIVLGLMFSRFKNPLNQPTVFIGGLILALCSAALTRAGVFGREAWVSVAALVTPLGAGVIFLGGALVGFLVLFNTSLDSLLAYLLSFLVALRRRILGVGGKSAFESVGRIKVSGGVESVSNERRETQGEVAISSRPAVNVPGQEAFWEYPPISLLQDSVSGKADRGDIKANADVIERTLESFGIKSKVVEVNLGPAVTQYAIEVALGTKLSKITTLSNDLALALAAPSGQVRIEAPIPGRSLVGLELPNKSPEFVALRTILEADLMKSSKSPLTLPLGLDVSGKSVAAELARMPHLLIAGQTGSGKSVAINSFISSILFRASPNEVKFVLVDPKRVELTGYNGIPHLLAPVIVESDKVVSALKYLINEMDQRYKMFAQVGARHIDAYNEASGFQALPYLVLVIDELADVMLFSPVEVEEAITRLAQMSRATGIHMVLSTQRPSVDVLTGLIKANIPARIAFAVSSQVDSRVILDTPGAERLLGRGDMLFLPPEEARPKRIQGCYISDSDTTRLVEFLRKTGVAPQYTEEVTTVAARTVISPGQDRDDLFEESVRLVCGHDKASASLLQRRLSIGYARAARILDQLEASGVVGLADGSKPREVLIGNADEFLAKLHSV